VLDNILCGISAGNISAGISWLLVQQSQVDTNSLNPDHHRRVSGYSKQATTNLLQPSPSTISIKGTCQASEALCTVDTHMHCLDYNAPRVFSGATQAHLQSRLPEGAYLYSLTIRVSQWVVQHASRSAMQCHFEKSACERLQDCQHCAVPLATGLVHSNVGIACDALCMYRDCSNDSLSQLHSSVLEWMSIRPRTMHGCRHVMRRQGAAQHKGHSCPMQSTTARNNPLS
jgi:hypothetical protein